MHVCVCILFYKSVCVCGTSHGNAKCCDGFGDVIIHELDLVFHGAMAWKTHRCRYDLVSIL